MSAFEEERQQLSCVLPQIQAHWQKLKDTPRYLGDDVVEQLLDDQRHQQLKRLDISLREPYFGRLDFQEEGTDEPRPLYIGKVGVKGEKDSDLLVIDWRAPVSSMFYTFFGQGETASYESLDGEVHGVVHLKRNIAIRNQVLLRVVDSYVRGGTNLGVTDEFLLYRLGENKDNRLRDIVSTIQAEQDRIIRSPLDRVLIIQGVPGSGKTTVALHRLAFLLYHYKEELHAERMMIFAPNKMFLDYISDVLPELGVEDIQQTTFISWALEILKEERLPEIEESAISSKSDIEEIRYKGSIQFYQLIQQALEDYESTSLPSKEFSPWEGLTLSLDTLRHWYVHEYKHYSIAKRKERIISRIKGWIETEYKSHRSEDSGGKMKKKALNRLRSYAKAWEGHSLLDVYKTLLEKAAADDHVPHLKYSLKKLKQKKVTIEDIPPLLYIYQYLHGISNQDTLEHVVIDEAQDVSPFQVMVLKAYTKNTSFTILGDLLQNIHHRGIESWGEFQALFPSASLQYHQLDTSYRSTAEIIHLASAVIEPYKKDVALPKPIFRSGTPVKVISSQDRVGEIIDQLLESGINTIAVVTRDEKSSLAAYALLQEQRQNIHLITSDQVEYQGGITVTPISLIKGMEFDAVLLLGVDKANYPHDEIHAKLLYVGCTRALHHLYLFHEEALSPLVQSISPTLYHKE